MESQPQNPEFRIDPRKVSPMETTKRSLKRSTPSLNLSKFTNIFNLIQDGTY